MIEEPPSTSPESNKGLGFFKKIRLFLRGLYKRVSYTPMNQKELSGVLKEAEEMNLIDKNILDMMEETLEFSSMQVRDVMIPRPQMIVVRHNEKPKEFLPRIIDSSHSRFPVVDEDSEEVKGILLAKELLPFGFSSNNHFNLEKVMRPVNFIPESKKLDSLLEEFRKIESEKSSPIIKSFFEKAKKFWKNFSVFKKSKCQWSFIFNTWN